jgi:hypothetical protein
MRNRYIKTSIMTNEDLADLGPYSYILFTGLWMLADKEGRLEYKPRRIKALAMPMWEISVEEIEALVRGLESRGMVQIYSTASTLRQDAVNTASTLRQDAEPTFSTFPQTDAYVLQVTNWQKHQHTDARERPSELPPPPPRDARNSQIPQVPEHYCVNTTSTLRQDCVKTGGVLSLESGVLNGSVSGEDARSLYGSPGGRASSPPPKPKTSKPKPTPPPSTPGKAPPAGERLTPRRKPPAKSEGEGRGRTVERARAAPTPQKAADVAIVRDSLVELARQVGMRPPDDALVLRVLDAGRGASGDEVHATLVELWRRNKFRSMYSWGFVPLVVAP